MLPDYTDIKEATGHQPVVWYDGNGVPRYADFHPSMLGVYDKFALLAHIRCQSCHKSFRVGCGYIQWNFYDGNTIENSLEKLATGFHYGDPPRHDCVGDTMNCEDVKILEAWTRVVIAWERDPSWEIDLLEELN